MYVFKERVTGLGGSRGDLCPLVPLQVQEEQDAHQEGRRIPLARQTYQN